MNSCPNRCNSGVTLAYGVVQTPPNSDIRALGFNANNKYNELNSVNTRLRIPDACGVWYICIGMPEWCFEWSDDKLGRIRIQLTANVSAVDRQMKLIVVWTDKCEYILWKRSGIIVKKK